MDLEAIKAKSASELTFLDWALLIREVERLQQLLSDETRRKNPIGGVFSKCLTEQEIKDYIIGGKLNGDYYKPAIPFGSIVCETRPLPTAKEQRAEKLIAVIRDYAVATEYRSVDRIEAIFAEYPLEEK